MTFLLAGVVLVVIPGPSVLFIVGRALAHGRRAALRAWPATRPGSSLVVVAVALGVGAVAAASAAVFTVLKLAGAAYLIYLGVQTYRTAATSWPRSVVPRRPGRSASVLAGRRRRRDQPEGARAVRGRAAAVRRPGRRQPRRPRCSCSACCSPSWPPGLDSVWGLVAGAARDWFATSPARLRRLGGAGGLMMIGLGATLALTGRRD